MLAVRGEVLADVYGIGHRNVRGEGGSGGRAGEYHTPASGIIWFFQHLRRLEGIKSGRGALGSQGMFGSGGRRISGEDNHGVRPW